MATATNYSPNMSVLEARARYFSDNAFGEDGGYSDRWVTLAKLGPLPIGFPNTPGRIKAVRIHDLHHLVTGYDTDFVGEAEIAAWELASGCQDFRAAWVLNTLALGFGVLLDSTRTRRAFARGCRSRNLYGEPFRAAVLDEQLGALRERLDVEVAGGLELELTTSQRARYRKFVGLGMLGNVAVVLIMIAPIVAVVLGIASLLGG